MKIEISDQQAKSLGKLLLRFLYKEEPEMLSLMDAINLKPIYEKLSNDMRKLDAPIYLFKAREEDEELSKKE